MPHRCAFGCKAAAADVVMHVFPNPHKYPERFKAWVSLVGGDFQTLSDNEIYKKKRICDIHFTNNHRNRFKRLNALAVPSLHLPNTSRATEAATAVMVQSVPVNAPVNLDASRAQGSFAAVEVNTPPMASLPVMTDHGQNDNICPSTNLLAEHNYSAASKARPRGSLPDSNECLQTLDFFLREKVEDTPDTPKGTDNIHFNNEICFDQQTHENDPGQSNYVCGWVLRKCLKDVVKGCAICKNALLDNNNLNNTNNAFIRAKEYDGKNWLCYPSQTIEKYFKDVQYMATSFLKNEVPKTCLKQTIMLFSDMLIDNDPFECPVHKDNLKTIFMNTTLNVVIYSWCRSVNRILSGKLNYNGEDITKTAAQNYYNKHKNYKNRK